MLYCGRRYTTNNNEIRFTLDEACEIKNLLHEYASALGHEVHKEGCTIKRVGLEKMSKDIFDISHRIQLRVDALTV